MQEAKISLIDYPTEADWLAVKDRALITIGKRAKTLPTMEWKKKILNARHSPIRRLNFSFLLEDIPSWVSVHLVRHHIGIQPYVGSQRNDRQDKYDRNAARQDSPVTMILDMNAEALMNLANKRLCNQASRETRLFVKAMCELVIEQCPEFELFLVPMCVYHGGECHEFNSCCGQNTDLA